MDDDKLTGWVKLFHPKGPQVTIPVTQEPLNYGLMLDNVTAMLAAGFLVTQPGLEAGEDKEQVGYVLKGSLDKKGEEPVPFVLLYSVNDAMTWSFLKVYLNTESDIAAFEHASKMKLDQIEEYVGNDKPERGVSNRTDRYIVKPPAPFGVIFKANPKYKEAEAAAAKQAGEVYPVPKRVFVRWEDSDPKAVKAIKTEKVETAATLRAKILPLLENAALQGENALRDAFNLLPEASYEAVKADKATLKKMAQDADKRRGNAPGR